MSWKEFVFESVKKSEVSCKSKLSVLYFVVDRTLNTNTAKAIDRSWLPLVTVFWSVTVSASELTKPDMNW